MLKREAEWRWVSLGTNELTFTAETLSRRLLFSIFESAFLLPCKADCINENIGKNGEIIHIFLPHQLFLAL